MMRKVFVILMTVCLLMGAFAVLPVSAINDEAAPSEIDGTTVADAEGLNLVVTEFMSNTTCSVTVGGQDVSAKNAFQYIEIYNRGTTAVDLYDLAVVRSNNLNSASLWNTSHRFEAKLSINPGLISQGVSATNTGSYCINPNTAILHPGEFAVIWFWNDDSITVSNYSGGQLGMPIEVNGNLVYHKAFRDHYRAENTNVQISDDLLVVAVYAGSTTDSSSFALNTSGSYMYALVKDETGGESFDHTVEPAFTANKGSDGTIYQRNDKVVCLWQWGTWTKQSIPSGNGYEGLASVYVPANCTPDFRNASNQAVFGDWWDNDNNYYEAGLVDGFKEVALVNFTESPTIGAMDAWQWAYVDPERAPESAKSIASGGKTWQQVAIESYINANLRIGEEVAAHPEEKIVVKPIAVAGDATVASLAGNDFLMAQNSTFSTENALVQGVGITTSFALAAVLELWRRGIARH